LTAIFIRITVLASAVCGAGPPLLAQMQSPEGDGAAATDRSVLMSAVNAEEKRGIVLFYSQSYPAGHKPVFFKGTLYAAITAFSANKGKLTIGSRIVDRYSGQVDRGRVDETQSSCDDSVEFTLTKEIAGSLRLIEARPSQLESGTNLVCAERKMCAIQWLQFQARSKVMKRTRVTNDIAAYAGYVKGFDGMVDEVWVPVSSESAGQEFISLKNFAATCSQ
jgi:hypothetical protein